jgi:hypothetical protein
MEARDEYDIPPEQWRLHELLVKVIAYQRSLPDGRAVELDELKREGVFDSADIEFLSANSVTYKPHRVSDYHAMDMFHMPTSDGGCLFTGPKSPRLKKRRMRLQNFQAELERFLKLPRPREELLLHIEFSKNDRMVLTPGIILFTFRTKEWLERLPAIRAVAAEFELQPRQDDVRQGTHGLAYTTDADPARIATATVALLARGCGIADRDKITYSAGALDER